ncbi:MAG: DUF4294 domain-containing protein [Chitinophagales bacterium]
MNKLTLIVFLVVSLYCDINAQGGFDDMGVIVLDQVIVGDDTLPAVRLEPVEIKAHLRDKVPDLDYKLKYHTRKAYPYAIRVSRIVAEIDEELSKLDSKRDKKKYLNSTEKLLKDEFKDDLKDLTRTQGKILIKLVYRETGYSVHELISMYRSDFKAGWWEFLAKRFDMSTKDIHDPEGEDAALEKYVQQLDLLYQRNGKKEKIINEQLDLSVQSKKRKRDRGSDESIQGESFDDR